MRARGCSVRRATHAPRRSLAGPPCGRRPRGRQLAAALALERREGRAGLSAGRPAGRGQPVADLRPPVGHEAGEPPLGLQQGDGPTPLERLHPAGEQGAGGIASPKNDIANTSVNQMVTGNRTRYAYQVRTR